MIKKLALMQAQNMVQLPDGSVAILRYPNVVRLGVPTTVTTAVIAATKNRSK